VQADLSTPPARRALNYVASVSHQNDTQHELARTAGAVALDTGAALKRLSAQEQVVVSLARGLQAELENPRHGAASPERMALNGASSGTLFAPLVQAATRMDMMGRQVRELASELAAEPDTDRARPIHEQLVRALDEARTVFPAMQAKTRALIAVVENAEKALVAAAVAPRTRSAQRQQTREALQFVITLRLALLDLAQAQSGNGSAYAQAHRAFLQAQQQLAAT
jgi:hypothetical protein